MHEGPRRVPNAIVQRPLRVSPNLTDCTASVPCLRYLFLHIHWGPFRIRIQYFARHKLRSSSESDIHLAVELDEGSARRTVMSPSGARRWMRLRGHCLWCGVRPWRPPCWRLQGRFVATLSAADTPR